MQSTQAQNGTNGDNGNGQLPDLTNREIVKLLLDEIAGVRKELKEDISALDRKLSERMDRLEGRMNKLETEMKSLRMGVHQNQITFMKSHEDLGKRVGVLEERVNQ